MKYIIASIIVLTSIALLDITIEILDFLLGVLGAVAEFIL